MTLNISDLDWRSLLVKRYKNYGLDEKSLAVILCVAEIEKGDKCLISADELCWSMTLPKEEIDSILANLLSRRLMKITEVGGAAATSLDPLREKILRDTQNDIIIESEDASKSAARTQGESIYGYFEQLLGRPLTSNEFDRVCSWFQEGATSGMVKEAVERVKTKSKRVTVAAVDKVMLTLERSKDIGEEGYTTRSDEWRQGADKTIEMLKSKWLPTDDK